MKYSKLSAIEAILLIVVVIINHIVLNLAKNFLGLCGSASILNVIYISLLAFVLFALVIKLFKNFKNSDIVDISEYLGGKVLKTIVGILFIVFFLFICGMLVRNFCEGLNLTYFSKTPIALLIFLFLLVATIANHYGSSTVVKCNLVIIPIMIVILIITFLSVTPNFTFQRVFPLFGYGLNETFLIGASNIFAYSGLGYLYFIMPMLAKKEDFKKVAFRSFFITAFLLLLCISSLLFALPYLINVQELTAIYLLIRSAEFGRFFQRPEAVFIFIWILSLMSYISINMMFVSRIFAKLTSIKSTKMIAPTISGIIFIIAMIPKGIPELKVLEQEVYKYVSLGLVFFLGILILILANIKYKKAHKNSLPQEETK